MKKNHTILAIINSCFLVSIVVSNAVLADTATPSKQTLFTLPITEARYDAKIKGFHLNATRSVKQFKNNQWEIKQYSTASVGKLNEISTFKLDYKLGLQTTGYSHTLKLTGVGRKYSVDFNRDSHSVVVTDSKKGELKFSSENVIYSDLSYQLAMRLALIKQPNIKEVEFTIVKNKNKLKHYVFKRGEEKTIETPVGMMRAVKFFYSKSTDEIIDFWLAVDYGYVLLNINTQENNKKVYELQLKELVFNGQAINLK